jgi:hypothetical protein
VGAWGLHFDENDDAGDWLAGFDDAPSWSVVDQALNLDAAGYLEAPECCEALAAAEIVAAGLGKASARLEPRFTAWAQENSDGANERRELARSSLARVRDGSELQELWEDTDEFADWQQSVDETVSRLG